MHLEIIFLSLTAVVSFLLSILLIFKWRETKTRFYSDLPFLFGVSILFIGFSTLLNLIYSLTFFITEITLFRIRGVLICITAVTMFTGVLKIWLPEKIKLLIVSGLIYAISFLIILFITPSASLIITYTSPFIAVNIIFVVVTFSVVYLKRRLPSINPLLIIAGALIILASQLLKAVLPTPFAVFTPDVASLVGWVVFTLGFLVKAPYFKTTAGFNSKSG
ncbi:MAG: hypothetical protein OdinLCB4_003350 [Candidatus Odinarchaeum yellowstonii]|uniref:Uncharacterized protein n=1 Tax=Odinarchaeota yellowstonii (strain LCB_4) TaxID=1841599 RepID=A0AAF0D3E5_ODILC|nr:MAG: hypothetical protein OdinLCB4_003350 [Candidatus Odinarchaeum yellowstonii]